jgi:hypothetical protein
VKKLINIPFVIYKDDDFTQYRKKEEWNANLPEKNGVYIEVDLRKIKTVEKAIEYIEKFS